MTAYTHARAGRKEKARMMVNELIKIWGDEVPTLIAFTYASLNEKNKAFEWLKKGIDYHDFLAELIKVEPAYDPLRSDPRFQNLLLRMNFPNE